MHYVVDSVGEFCVFEFMKPKYYRDYKSKKLDYKSVGKWSVIRTQEDIDLLMNEFWGFHDFLIKEVRFILGVNSNGRLSHVQNNRCELSAILQCSQTIELLFEDFETANLATGGFDSEAIIWGAYITFEDNKIVWFNSKYFRDSYIEMYNVPDITWVRTRSLKWRVLDEIPTKDEIFVYSDSNW